MRVRDESKVDSILQQALKMIVEEGFDGLSMQKLAKAAGDSPATIYIYYKDRDDLLLHLFKMEKDRYFAYILQGFDPEMDFATGLNVQWKNRAKYVIDHPDKAHFMEHFSFTPLHGKSMKMRDKRFSDTMHRFVKKPIANRKLVKMRLKF